SGAAALAATSSASSNRLSDCLPASPSPLTALATLRPYPDPPAELSTEMRDDARLSTGSCARRTGSAHARHDEPMSAEPLPPRLEVQAAAIARRQGAELGIDPEAMQTRLRSGRWQRLQRGVYATFSGEPARETVLWAALLRVRPDAVLSHHTAAERPGLTDEPSSMITIPVPASKRPARVKIPGVLVHRSDAILRTKHPVMLPPCTRVEDTVLDLIQIAPTFDDAYAWICRAVGR